MKTPLTLQSQRRGELNRGGREAMRKIRRKTPRVRMQVKVLRKKLGGRDRSAREIGRA